MVATGRCATREGAGRMGVRRGGGERHTHVDREGLFGVARRREEARGMAQQSRGERK